MIHTLRKAGYKSYLAGVQHIIDKPQTEQLGYDRILTNDRYYEATDRVWEFLKSAPQEPFFLDVGFFDTHRNFFPADPADDPRYCMPPAPLPDTPKTRQDMADFKSSARRLDAYIGKILGSLDRFGFSENTLVICTTDHGIAFPYMKCNLTDHGTGVMLMMRGPGGFTGGKVIDGMVSQIDIFPTICELLEIEKPQWLQGTSMLPLVRGEKDQINEQIFSEVTYHASYEPMRSVRTKRYKYIRHFDSRSKMVWPNCDASVSKELFRTEELWNRPVAAEQLYDLFVDPHESCNLAEKQDVKGVLGDMRSRLQKWMIETKDPLLNGPVYPPKGAKVNHPDEALTEKGTALIPDFAPNGDQWQFSEWM